ncbi:family 16 glycosylhydrolase [uncultured Winogradskyella sp.]|uniref:family 16 glycosylhydrolase n=1 Tax=uncultured Winogradskyella sp. TaxID=395353 RepID=UPI0030DB1F97|tara:strand:+ start:110838 stop:112394 length:1557 start_codon:yes stop_codon:yes gene_type:complete
MKLNYITLVVLCISFQLSIAQQMPIDFSDGTDNFTAFDNSSFSFNTNPDDTNDPVGQFFNDGSIAWQGFYVDLNQAVNLSSAQTITLSFYSFDPNTHNVMVKLENGTNANVEVVQSTSGSGWSNDLTFNFANATFSGTNTAVNATGTYTRLVIFVDGGQTIPGTYLIDDIDDGSEPTDPHQLDVIYTDLVWADEFDTNGAIDGNNWFHQTQLPGTGSWFNGEVQHYTDRIENSSVDNGFLNITAIKEPFTDQGQTKQYTSARLNSKFAFTYGRVDVRAKLPFGDGTWPAIWTLGKNINEDGAYWDNQGFGTTSWPACGEIDIMEHGLGAINHVSSAIHTPSSFGATINYQAFVLNDVANDFHVYSVNWSPNKITFLIDGVGFYSYNPVLKDSNTWPFFEDQYIILNIAMGGISGAIDPNFTESSMDIDYVRVFQNTNLSVNDEAKNLFSVYPNPTSNLITISTTKPIGRLELYNTLGQLVLEKDGNTRALHIEALQTGIYSLKIYSENAVVTKRVIKN